jgi:hypothetical protein
VQLLKHSKYLNSHCKLRNTIEVHHCLDCLSRLSVCELPSASSTCVFVTSFMC